MSTKTGRKTILGVFWMFLATGIGKFATLMTQIVLGWQLSKEDFGLYALTLSVSASVALLRNGGTQQILIQRGDEYNEIAPNIFKFSLIFNCIACVLLLAISPIAAFIYKSPELKLTLSIIAISIVLMTPYGLLRAKLVIDHKFKEISAVTVASNVARQGGTIICAFMGLGYMSFMWPILLEPIVLIMVSYYFVKGWLDEKKLTRKIFWKIFSDAKWVMLGSLAIALSSSGEYFVIGLYESKENLGVYFFGFQLIVALTLIIITVNDTIFLPILTSLSADSNKFKSAYTNLIFVLGFSSLLIIILMQINVKWMVGFIWQGKWDQAVPIIQALALTIPAVLFTNINKVVLESKGMWKRRLIELAVFVIGDIVIAGLSAWKYDIYVTAINICIYRNIFALIQFTWMARIVNISIKSVMSTIIPNVVLVLFVLMNNLILMQYIDIFKMAYYQECIVLSIIAIVLFVAANMLFEKSKLKVYIKQWR